MSEPKRISAKQIFDEVQAMRKDISTLMRLLIGCADEPDKPGLVERVRILETNQRFVKWLASIAVVIVVGDIVMRMIDMYRGTP